MLQNEWSIVSFYSRYTVWMIRHDISDSLMKFYVKMPTYLLTSHVSINFMWMILFLLNKTEYQNILISLYFVSLNSIDFSNDLNKNKRFVGTQCKS